MVQAMSLGIIVSLGSGLGLNRRCQSLSLGLGSLLVLSKLVPCGIFCLFLFSNYLMMIMINLYTWYEIIELVDHWIGLPDRLNNFSLLKALFSLWTCGSVPLAYYAHVEPLQYKIKRPFEIHFEIVYFHNIAF